MAQAELWLHWTASALAQGGWAELASAEGTFEQRPEWLEGASGTKLPSGQRGAQAERQASTRALSAAGAQERPVRPEPRGRGARGEGRGARGAVGWDSKAEAGSGALTIRSKELEFYFHKVLWLLFGELDGFGRHFKD